MKNLIVTIFLGSIYLPIVVISFHGCMSHVVAPSYSGICYICISRENWHFASIIVLQFMISANNRYKHYCLHVVFVCLHISPYHHYVNLSEGIAFLKCLSNIGYIIMSKINSILSVTFFNSTFGAMCLQPTHLPCDGCENV